MKKNVLLLLLGLSSAAALAQAPQPQPQQTAITNPKGNASISGEVVDAETGKPVEFATVALISQRTGKPVDGTMVDGKGHFSIQKVAAGAYKLNVSFLGYQLQTVENVAVATDNANVNVGTVSLASDTKKLSEVVVTGEKPLVEEKIDRTVYNADKDITNAGGTAADVLQKVPSLSLDNDGNVQLRGSGNVRILINNKPSAIVAGNVADALKQIPADQIKSVEVITSPSAKYDAEGTAGIINIITKKEGLEGVTGSVSLTGGTRNSNGNASLNVRRGKFGVNGTFGGNLFYNRGNLTNAITSYDNESTAPDETSYSFQSGNTHINGAFMNGQLGFDYDITPKNTLSGGVRTNGGRFRMRNEQEAYATGIQAYDFMNKIRNRTQRIGTDYNLDFVHSFAKPQQELAILSLYSVTNADNFINQDYFQEGEAPFQLIRNTNDNVNEELTFQVDYTHPFENKTQLEVGVKNILRDVESNATYSETPAPAQPRPDNDLFYEQDVYATYLTYGFTLKKKLNVKVGGRYEYTDVSADLQGAAQDYSTNYDNVIPSVSFSYSLKDKHTFKANFTQRIQRPSMFFLNPYRQKQTSNTYVQGNPTLNAELTDLYELGYSTYFNTSSVNATLYMRQTDNAIEPFATFFTDEEGKPATLLSFQNIARNKTYGVSLFGNTKPVKAWTVSGSSNIYFVDLNSAYASNSGWMYNINLNSSYDFGKGFSAQFNGGFNSRRIQLLGEFASFSYHGLAIKKELFDKKGGISLGLDNPLRESMRMKNDVRAEATPTNPTSYEQHIRINNFNRGARITFDYRFGKMDQQKPPKRKKSIRNDDTKQGDGNGVG